MEVKFDKAVFHVDSVKKAAYRFLDRFTPEISLTDEAIGCCLTFPAGTSAAAMAAIIEDFKKEVLDQELRRSIALETEAYRNAILALAFAPLQRTRK